MLPLTETSYCYVNILGFRPIYKKSSALMCNIIFCMSIFITFMCYAIIFLVGISTLITMTLVSASFVEPRPTRNRGQPIWRSSSQAKGSTVTSYRKQEEFSAKILEPVSCVCSQSIGSPIISLCCILMIATWLLPRSIWKSLPLDRGSRGTVTIISLRDNKTLPKGKHSDVGLRTSLY